MKRLHWWLHAVFLTALAGGYIYVTEFMPQDFAPVVIKKEIKTVEVPVVKYLDKVKTEYVDRKVKVYVPTDEQLERIHRELRLRPYDFMPRVGADHDNEINTIVEGYTEDFLRNRDLLTITDVPKMKYGGTAAALLDRDDGETHIIISQNPRPFFGMEQLTSVGAWYGYNDWLMQGGWSTEIRHEFMRTGNVHWELRYRLNDIGGENYWGAEAGIRYQWDWNDR